MILPGSSLNIGRPIVGRRRPSLPHAAALLSCWTLLGHCLGLGGQHLWAAFGIYNSAHHRTADMGAAFAVAHFGVPATARRKTTPPSASGSRYHRRLRA